MALVDWGGAYCQMIFAARAIRPGGLGLEDYSVATSIRPSRRA
jgi:hypothetical protein